MSTPLSRRTITQVLATSTGGVGVHVRSIAADLVSAGADLRIVGPQATEDLFGFTAEGAQFAAVEIANGPDPRKDARAVRRLRAATSDADLIHAHGLRAATVAAAANLGRRTPLVVTLHNAVDVQSPALRRVYAGLERFVARSADVVIGASQDLADRARECGAKYVLFREVAAPPALPAQRTAAQVREELRLPAEAPVLLCVGRLHPQKGYDTLIAAAGAWQDHPLRPEVIIAGDGPLESELRRDIDAASLRIRLLGRRSDVADLLEAADLVLMPSVWEARSLVAQEAMRAGVALICTTTGGMGELVGDAARTIDVGDSAGLAQAVLDLLEDPQKRADLAEAGRRRAADFPTQRDTALALIEIYRELLGQGTPG
ncbi:glycosyltransferase family 4 protein [Cumulibacter soli]|uniref:glycosyltransferase family 4 protein n=1 Tax=Cumulibacter soli TaxID=2546344 RepID=UPI001068C6FF|nr:glycosyltransferase family 4 protein [Cumulibacter soli]